MADESEKARRIACLFSVSRLEWRERGLGRRVRTTQVSSNRVVVQDSLYSVRNTSWDLGWEVAYDGDAMIGSITGSILTPRGTMARRSWTTSPNVG